MSTWTSLKIELIPTGDQSGLWGVTTNNNFQYAIEEAITGSGNVTFASNNQTLTLVNSNLSQTGRKLRLNLTGVTGGATRTLFVPSMFKQYLVHNGCADPILITNGADPTPTGTGVTIPAGRSLIVFNDGVNVVPATNYAPSMSFGTALSVSSGGTGVASFGVGLAKVNGTSAFTTAVAGVDYSLPPPANTNILTGNGAGGFSTVGAPSPGFLQWTGSAYIWNTAIGAGSVTYVDVSGGTTGLTFAGGPVTTVGTFTLGGTLNPANGGTGSNTVPANGQILIGNGTTYTAAALTAGSGVTVVNGAGSITVSANGEFVGTASTGGNIKLYEGTNNGNNYVSFKAPDLIPVDTTWTLPNADGMIGQALITDGSGNLYWGTTGGGVTYTRHTSNVLADAGEGIIADTTGGSFTVTLPAGPAVGDQVAIVDGGNWGVNNLTVGRNGSTIAGVASDLILNITGAAVTLIYDSTTWQVYAQVGGNGGTVVTLNDVQTLTNKTLVDPKILLNGTNGTAGQMLTSAGTGVAPVWTTPVTRAMTYFMGQF